MIILYNPENKNQIQEFESENQIGGGFSNWKNLEGIELNNYKLQKAKTQKHHELIEAYNIAISKPHPIYNAPKLDKLNNPIGFTDAEFLIKDPLKSAIPIPYITKDKDGNEVKIHLTGAEVYNIFKHLFTRLQIQSGACENLKTQIEQANSIEDLEKINLEILKK